MRDDSPPTAASARRRTQHAQDLFEAFERSPDGVLIANSDAPVVEADGHVTICMAAARDGSDRVHEEAAIRHLNEALERQAGCIAERLHDEAGQLLTAAYIALAEAARRVPAACEPLQQVRTHLDTLEAQLRQIAHELRPRILDDLGLVAALEFLAAGVATRWGMSVAVEGSVRERLPSIVEATIYRFGQEALTNASRHARATRVLLTLENSAHAVRCTVLDNGIGFDAAAVLRQRGHVRMGLRALQERINSLGGTLDIDSSPEAGTSLTATIPLET